MSELPSLGQLVAAYASLADSDTSSSALPAQIADGINAGDYRLVLLVKELGEALTSENDAQRAKGVGLLSAVVTKVDKNTLDRQSTKTLTTFFTDKLSEKTSLVASATALSALTESASFGVGEGMEVARGIFAHVTLKSHPQPVRNTVYTLLDHLMSHSRPALKRLGTEFLAGYCELVEGEKDPRNLMISFSLIRVMLLEFDVVKNIEDIFDVTFCYFPITFTPPPDDPYGISSEDLIISLRACLASTPLFGQLALPLFYDKLQAASEKAKLQTLQALTACFPIYGAEVSGEWAGRFSEALSIEVFHATDTAMQDLALASFRSLFSTLYPDSTPSAVSETLLTPGGEDAEMVPVEDGAEEKGDEKIVGIVVQVVENSLDEFKEPEKNNAKPAVRILTALIASSARLAHYVLSASLPPLLSIYKNPDDMSVRPAVLTHISTLLASLTPSSTPSDSTATPTSVTPAPAAPIFPPPPALTHANGSSPLEPYRDDLLSILTSSTRSLTTRNAALEGLVNLVRLPSFLSIAEVEFCISAINDVLSTTSSSNPSGADEDAYFLALSSLVTLTSLHPRIIEDTTLPLLFASLPVSVSPAPNSAESKSYRLALESLAELCLSASLFAILARRIADRLEEVLAASFADGDEAYQHAALYAHHLLSTLRAVVGVKSRQGDEDVEGYVEGLVPQLVAMVVLPTTRRAEAGQKTVAEDVRIVVDVGKTAGLILQKVGVERQTSFAQGLNEAFHRAQVVALLGEKASKEVGNVVFAPFKSTSPPSQQNLLSIYTSLLLPLSPSVPIPASDLLDYLRLFLSRSLSASYELQLQACAWGLASLINKRAGEPHVSKFVDEELGRYFEEEVKGEGKPEGRRKAALRVWTWIAKALIVRSDQRGYVFVEQLLDLFSDEKLGRHAATGLGVIAEDNDGVLSKEKGAVIRFLYKQRFFTFLLPKLVLAYKDTAGHADAQAVYLIALSSLLQHLPKQLALTELPKLLPLLITSLDLPDRLLRANVIEALAVLVKEVPTEIDNSISSITGKILKGLSSGSGTGEKGGQAAAQLRLASLLFLETLPAHIPYLTLHSQKPTVLKELGKAVDDPRRDVRRAAVDCRGKWFLYSGGGGD